jgi:hypothetical protein
VSTTSQKKGTARSVVSALRNVRVEDDIWIPAGPAAARAGTDRSKVARDAWQALIDRENDEVWQEASRLAAARGTTPEAVQRRALEQWVRAQQRREQKKT